MEDRPTSIFCQGTTRQGGREATPSDIARNRKSFPPKTFGAPLSERNHRTKMIPQERLQTIAAKWMRLPIKSGRIFKTRPLGSRYQILHTASEPPPKTLEIGHNQRDTPQDQSGDPQYRECVEARLPSRCTDRTQLRIL